MFQNLPGHIPKCIVTIYAVTVLVDCGVIYHLCHFCCFSSFLHFPLNSVTVFLLAVPLPQVLHNEVTMRGVFFFFTVVGRFSFFFPASASSLLVGRQLWIIKWWIRGYFLPTQTCGGWAGILAVGFIPLSSQNATKSHCCPSSPSKKRVESPHIPVLVPRQDQRALDAAGKNSCGNKKQQSTSVDYLFFSCCF